MVTISRDGAPSNRHHRLDVAAAAPVPTDAPAEMAPADEGDQGRVGYGRFARFTPLALALLLIAALAAIGLVQSREDGPAAPVSDLVGKPAPDVTLTLLDGTPLRLADLRGSVVILNFWASWCTFCPDEMRLLQTTAAATTRTSDPLAIVGVGLRIDHNDRARAMVRDLGLTYPIGRDTATDAPGIGPVQRAFGIANFVPATIFIRPDGIVAGAHLGPLTAEQISAEVTKAVEQARL